MYPVTVYPLVLLPATFLLHNGLILMAYHKGKAKEPVENICMSESECSPLYAYQTKKNKKL